MAPAVITVFRVCSSTAVVILKVIGAVIGLRVDQQDEIEGLDLSQHGERGYHSH